MKFLKLFKCNKARQVKPIQEKYSKSEMLMSNELTVVTNNEGKVAVVIGKL